jgi:release factor glutamine methyltransferase
MSSIASVREYLDHAARQLQAAACPSAHDDATALLAHVLGVPIEQVPDILDRPVQSAAAAEIDALVLRRTTHEPLAYIVGTCRFRDLDLMVDHRVHVPEPESGALVDIALSLPAGSHVHEVGTGCGAIALSIKHERPDLIVTASDIAPTAIAVARDNGARLALDVVFTVVAGLPMPDHYDLVVTNLPYADDAQQSVLVRREAADHQPHIAVFAGHDALGLIRALITQVPSGVTVALQHDPSQSVAVRALLSGARPIGPTVGPKRFTVGKAP